MPTLKIPDGHGGWITLPVIKGDPTPLTKAGVEAVLTGRIHSHDHNPLISTNIYKGVLTDLGSLNSSTFSQEGGFEWGGASDDFLENGAIYAFKTEAISHGTPVNYGYLQTFFKLKPYNSKASSFYRVYYGNWSGFKRSLTLDDVGVTFPRPSNPNLLINGDFQVWQRGTSFTGDNLQYSADRWQMYYAKSVAYFDNVKALRFDTGTTADRGMRYIIDPTTYTRLAGKKCTFSLKLLDAPGLTFVVYGSGGTIIDSGVIPFSVGTYTKTVTMPADINGWTYVYVLIRGTFTNQAHYLNYAKLELGEVATDLAPRPYAEELLLCQRYYRDLSIGNLSPWVYEGLTTRRYAITYPVMRTTPTIDVTGLTENRIWTEIASTSRSPYEASSSFFRLTVVSSAIASADNTYIKGNIKLDAEIY